MHPALLLYAVRQVGMYITSSVVLWGTSAAKISSAFFPCKVPRDHCVSSPATSLTVSSVGAAYMPPAHLFLDHPCNLPSPCRGRAYPARALPKASTPILNNSPRQPPRPHQLPANLTQQRVFRGSYFTDKRAQANNARPYKSFFDSLKHTRCSPPPMAHQAPAFPENSNKKIPRSFLRGILWCTIGDSNPGPTD